MPPELATDLITPLGAYLHLRGDGAGAFLLESVERGRLGRSSFVGSGTRLVPFEELASLDGPAGGFLGYERVARLRPAVPVPGAGPDPPPGPFVAAATLAGFHPPPGVRARRAGGMAEVLRGAADALARRLREPPPVPAPVAAAPSPTRRFPDRETYEDNVRRAKEHIRAGDVFQIVLAQRAERPTAAGAVAL